MFNARSVANKLLELHELLDSNRYHVIAITETWLSDKTVSSLLLNQSDYIILRKDRINKVGGGVCVLVKKSLKVKEIDLKLDTCIDMMAFDILNCDVRFRIFVCYRPPGSDVASMNSCLDEISSRCQIDATPILLGDFNLPGIDWPTNNFPRLMNGCQCNVAFLEFVRQQSLLQCVHEPTRADNILDLVLTDDPFAIFDLHVLPPFSTSDHNSIVFKIRANMELYNTSRMPHHIFKLADWDAIFTDLNSVDWSSLFNNAIETCWSNFYDVLYKIIDDHVPLSAGRASFKTRRLSI